MRCEMSRFSKSYWNGSPSRPKPNAASLSVLNVVVSPSTSPHDAPERGRCVLCALRLHWAREDATAKHVSHHENVLPIPVRFGALIDYIRLQACSKRFRDRTPFGPRGTILGKELRGRLSLHPALRVCGGNGEPTLPLCCVESFRARVVQFRVQLNELLIPLLFETGP